MSTPSHTPGPWRVDTENPKEFSGMENWGECYAIVSCDADPVKELYVGFVLTSEDAQLIAAAPDLLAFTEAVEGIIAWARDNGANPEAVGSIESMRRAAIAKAEGKSWP